MVVRHLYMVKTSGNKSCALKSGDESPLPYHIFFTPTILAIRTPHSDSATLIATSECTS